MLSYQLTVAVAFSTGIATVSHDLPLGWVGRRWAAFPRILWAFKYARPFTSLAEVELLCHADSPCIKCRLTS